MALHIIASKVEFSMAASADSRQRNERYGSIFVDGSNRPAFDPEAGVISMWRRSLPEGLSFTGAVHTAADVSFLSDMTWVDAEGAQHNSQQIFDTAGHVSLQRLSDGRVQPETPIIPTADRPAFAAEAGLSRYQDRRHNGPDKHSLRIGSL